MTNTGRWRSFLLISSDLFQEDREGHLHRLTLQIFRSRLWAAALGAGAASGGTALGTGCGAALGAVRGACWAAQLVKVRMMPQHARSIIHKTPYSCILLVSRLIGVLSSLCGVET